MPGQSAARRSHWRRDSPPRSAGRGSGSSRRARAVPVPDHADLRGRRPGVRQSPAVARWPTAAKSRHPKSTDRRRKQCARVCPSPIANQVESPCFLPWWGRTPSASVDPASATKSYTKPKVYLLPASPLMRPGELFGLRVVIDDVSKPVILTLQEAIAALRSELDNQREQLAAERHRADCADDRAEKAESRTKEAEQHTQAG